MQIRLRALALVLTVCGVGAGVAAGPAAADPAPGVRYAVDPALGDDLAGTGSTVQPFRTIRRALDAAATGETVVLRPGVYLEDVKTVRPGVTVTGPRDAVLRGAGGSRIVEVQHDDTTLSGFTIDGQVCAALVEQCFRGKAVYVTSTVPRDGVSGTRILGMHLTNLGDECVRIKYFATGSLVSGNEIGPCGIHDFAIPNAGTGQNGEGVYLGTAPEQLANNPTPDPDVSRDNRIANNIIDTRGAECVDIKESATANLVEHNVCTGQHPRNANSGAMDARGPGNTFRFNQIEHNAAAGIRIGGDRPGDAVGNSVYSNVISHNARGGIKVQDFGPHGAVCGNAMQGNVGGNVVGEYFAQIPDPTLPCPA